MVSTAQVVVTTTATLLATGVGKETQVFLQPQSDGLDYLGDSNVTTGNGFLLGGARSGPFVLGNGEELYAVRGSGSETVQVLMLS